MPPDLLATYASPDAPLTGLAAASRLRLSMQAGPICLIPRVIDPGTASALDHADPAALPAFDVSGSQARVRRAIAAAMDVDHDDIGPLVAWLREDVLGLVELFAATGSPSVRARLEVVRDDKCRAFHVDAVAFRLVTTYRGPGTEWIPPRALARAVADQPFDPATIRRLDRGTIALLRGEKAAVPDRPGVLHRSPTISGTGETRLFLAINEASR